MKVVNYIKNIFVGIWHLGQGMYVTMLNFCRPKVTQQYPENRGRREYGERFRALLTMPHDAKRMEPNGRTENHALRAELNIDPDAQTMTLRR